MKMKAEFIGIDIGSISASIVVLNNRKEIIHSEYTFHKGKIQQILNDFFKNLDMESCVAIGATSSTPDIIPTASCIDSRVCYITAARHFNNKVGSILIVGGEKFGVVDFDENGEYLNYRSNTSCAAGTGSFLDQQAGRLNLSSIQEFSTTACSNTGDIPKIASRCAVFAKTDLIHAQQEGYKLEEICDGLSYGLAKNIADTLFSNKKPHMPMIFAGGVSKNNSVVKHVSHLLESDILIDDYSHIYGAVGAAIYAFDENKSSTVSIKNHLISETKKEKIYHYDPLTLQYSQYPDFLSTEQYNFNPQSLDQMNPVEVDIYQKIIKGDKIDGFIGFDIGSTSTKAVVTNSKKDILLGLYTRTAGKPVKAVQSILEAINDISERKGISFNITGAGTTGSGRKFVKEIIGADIALDEISAHARAAYELDPDVDTIIEIGGQDSKFTTLQNGRVTFSIMNNVCAAGTGSFIEEQVEKLGCTLSDYTILSDDTRAPMASDRCTVFMERDINNYLNEGYSINEILASILHSVRENYLSKVAVESNIGNKIFFQGATAKNKSLVAAFEQKLKKPIIVSKFCHLTGAYGVALHLQDQIKTETSFRGIDIYKQAIPVDTEVCELCQNLCKIRIANINNEKVAFGFLCGRDYETKKFINDNTSNFNLLNERKKLLSVEKASQLKTDITIGLPAGLHMVDEMPMWEKFFALLGIKTITSEKCKDPSNIGKRIAGSEFCAPLTALHGHVSYLIEKADYIFIPSYLEQKYEKKWGRKQYCYYTQYSHSIISCIKGIDRDRLIMPLVRSLAGSFSAKVELFKAIKKITTGISFAQVSSAFDKAGDFQSSTDTALKDLFTKNYTDDEDISVVFLGRPYTVLSPSMNKNIPGIFAKQGIKTYFQDMIPYNKGDISYLQDLSNVFHWVYSAQILEAADVAAKKKGLYPVLVTSFKCSPDSFALDYFKDIMNKYDKPYLILQLDDHDSSVGYETRIEAGIRSFRNHFDKNIPESSDIYIPEFHHNIESNTAILKDKLLLMPNFENLTCSLIEAHLKSEGYNTQLIEETEDTIHKSLQHNTGQCLPLNAIAQNSIEHIEKHNLDPKETILWIPDSGLACNIHLFPYHIKRILSSYGQGMDEVSIYLGDVTFLDMSINNVINTYFAYMFGGFIRKIGCKIRPYEINNGETDKAVRKAQDILYDAFLNKTSKETALKKAVEPFKKIKTSGQGKPQVAIFGDLYVRFNDVFNQNLIQTIEANGGEVITTPYSDLMKICADSYIKKWFVEGNYSDAATGKLLKTLVPMLEKKYFKIFNQVLQEQEKKQAVPTELITELFGVNYLNSGESLENLLKIISLVDHYENISLFVQTNPSYCCPSLVTEAMADRIEEITDVPVVTIEYDGTCGSKNDDIIPYLKYPRNSLREQKRNIL